MTDTEFNAVKAFLSAYRYTELDLRVRRAELTRLTARKEALILEGNTDLLFHLEHAICAAKDAIRVLCTRQAEIEAAIDTVESAALREILTQHYICALDLKEIAERMHYSDRHMRRLAAGVAPVTPGIEADIRRLVRERIQALRAILKAA